MCCYTAEYKGVHISQHYQSRTYLHGAKPEFDAKSNNPNRLWDFEWRITRTDKNWHSKLVDETDKIAERNANQ